MKVITRSGLNFVIDLVWQKDDAENKINIYKIKKTYDFVLYAKTSVIESSYCFLPNTSQVNTFINNKTPLYSLTVFVLESLRKVFSGIIEDSFICFKIDDKNYGVIFIYKGGVIANDGEIIGNSDDIKEYILKNANRYNVLVTHVLNDVTFLLENDFLIQNGIELIKHDGPTGENNASNFYLWDQKDSFQTASKKSQLKPFSVLSPEKQNLIKKVAAGAVLVILLLVLASLIKNWWEHRPKPQAVKVVVKPSPPVVPVNNLRGLPIDMVIPGCFNQLNDLPGYLEIESLDCNLSRVQVTLSVHDYTNEDATRELRKKFIKANGTVSTENQNSIFLIKLVFPIDLYKIPPPKLNNDELITKLRLEKLALVHDMKTTFSKEEIVESVVVETPPSEAEKQSGSMPAFKIEGKTMKVNFVTLISPYSPFYLNKNNVLDDINIYNISMSVDQNRAASWVIKGEYSND